MRLTTASIFLTVLAVALAALAPNRARAGTEKRLDVFADIGPVAYLVEQIGGRHVSVSTLVPSHADPHVFEPTARQVAALSKARLFFNADLPLDRQIFAKFGSLGRRLVFVDTAAGIEKRGAPCGPGCTHDHGPEHGHRAADPHVWLSPPLLRVMAANVAAALEKADPSNADEYRKNFKRLAAQIEQTDASVGKRLAPYRGRAFYVFHPAFSYLAEHYGLKQRAVQIEGRAPSPKHLRAIVKQAKADRVGAVFSQGQFDRRPAEIVANAIGAKLLTIDPLAKDVLANLDDLSKKLAKAMRDNR